MLRIESSAYFFADPHFCHKNIITFCNRPYILTNDFTKDRKVVEQMNEDILKHFDRLPDECEVWLLGDIWFLGGSKQYQLLEQKNIVMMQKMVHRMKGLQNRRQLYLILGNHDTLFRENESRIDFYRKLGFDKVYDTPIIVNDNIVLSHEPVYIPTNVNMYNIHGHIHEKIVNASYFGDKLVDPSHYFNVCWDYRHKISKLVFRGN